MSNIKAYLHVVYAAFGDASILEFQSGNKRRFYLVDGGPIRYTGAGGTEENRAKKLTKLQLTHPYYQYVLYTLTSLAKIPNSTGVKLDGAIVTHPHADHLDGVERLFRELLPDVYQESVTSASPDKRLICNGPVLLTRKFAQDGKAYRSFSEFLLKTKFEISLDIDDIQNAFGNDIIFSFPTSPGVLYQRHKPSKDEKPHLEEKQRSKLKGGTEDKDLNKSSIILYTKEGGKICLTGDAYGYDIVAMLRGHEAYDLDIFKLPHHGSSKNSILGKVMPPSWAFQNLAAMVLLSLSLNQKILCDKNPEEERDLDYFRQQLIRGPGMGNGEAVQRIADKFLEVIKKQLKNTTKETPEELFHKVKEKHLEVLAVLQLPSECVDPCKNVEALSGLANWESLKKNVADDLVFPRVSTNLKKRKIEWWPLIVSLMSNDNIFQDYFAGKIGIDGFFESFHSKTYYVSASGRYEHPSPDVIKGIIKAAVKKNKPCRVVFTSGGAVPSSYLPNVNKKPFKQWNKFVSLYYLKNNVSFKLDPNEEINTAPVGTSRFENDDNVRIDVSQQLGKNDGFTIPRRSFLPNLDQYYVKTKGSDGKPLWLEVKNDGKLCLTPRKGAQNILNVSNAPSIAGDLNLITLQRESKASYQRDIWLEKASGAGFLIKGSPEGNYFFEEDGFLKCTNKKNKAIPFVFDHKTFSGPLMDERWISLKEFLKSLGSKRDQKTINVRGALELLLGLSNVERLRRELPAGSIGYEALDNEVDMDLSIVELSSSVDCKVISSKIQVLTKLRPMMFDASPVNTLEVVVKDLCSKPDVSLLITTSVCFANYALNVSEHMKPKEPSVDMYLNALGGVPLENRDKLTLGTILQRVMGYLPLEALAKAFPTHLLGLEIFTWKVDRLLSTVNYFTSPLAVEVLNGDFYLILPTEKNKITLGGALIIELSQCHVTVKYPRTERSDFVIECEATIGTTAVNLRIVPTSTVVPEVIICFSESANFLSVVKMLDPPVSIEELAVPLLNKVIHDLQLSKPTIRVVQDIQSYDVTRVSSMAFEFALDNFASILPTGLSSPQGSQATITIFNPLSSHPHIGYEVQFKLALATSTDANAFLDSKFSLWPVDASNHHNSQAYACSISLCPNLPEISMQTALEAIGLGQQMTSMMSFFPFMVNILNAILLNKITLDVNYQKRAIESFSLSLFVPQCSIIEEKFTIQEATFLVQYGCHQWYAEAEVTLLVFNKFTCRAAFSLPKPDVPGTLTFKNGDDSFTLHQFLEGIGFSVLHDLPVIDEILDVMISRAAISFENNGSTLKLTEIEVVLRKRTLSIGSISLYNLEATVRYADVQGRSPMCISLRGYLNPKSHATLTFDTERRELLGHYILVDNMSTDECLERLFPKQKEDCFGSNAYMHVKSFHVQEVNVILSFPSEKQWHLRKVRVRIDGSLTLGPFVLHQLCLVYTTELSGNATKHISVVGQFKSNDQTLSFTVELSSTSQEASSTILEAVIKPGSPGRLTLSSLLRFVGLKSPEDKVPQVDGSPDFLNIELKEACLQFEASPFRIRKMDAVVKTTAAITALEKPLIQLHEARLEYHQDETKDPAQVQIFIAGIFSIGKLPLNVTFKRDKQLGLVLEGLFNKADHSTKVDFEEMANQISPSVPFSLPRSVALSSFLFRLEKGEETTSLKLEGESHSNWSLDAGFSTLTVHNLGGKVHFKRERSSNAWSGSVSLNGKVLVQDTLDVAVEVYHNSKGETVLHGTVQNPPDIDLDVITKSFATGSDSSNSWKGLLPHETDATVRCPRFNRASLSVNVSKRLLLFFGTVAGFGTGLLIVKKTASGENSPRYGFLFGLSLGNDFRFSSINESLNVVDEVILVQNANLCVISKEFEQLTVAEMLKEISELEDIEKKQLMADLPFTNLESQSISDQKMRSGMTVFAKIDFSKGESKLLSNVTKIQERQNHSEIVLFAHIAENGSDTEFMAHIPQMEIFAGHLQFHGITLMYQPSKEKTLSLKGMMGLTLTEDSQPITFRGGLEISESKADFTMEAEFDPGIIREPLGMFGISIEDPELHLSWRFDQDEKESIVPVCSISGTVKFYKSGSTSEDKPVTALTGSIFLQEGRPVVAMVSLDFSYPLSIDDLFAALFERQWPSGYLDIGFKKGEIYYAKSNVEINGKTFQEGFKGETEIEVFDYAFGVELSIDERGMRIKGSTKFEIDLVIATLTGKNFGDDEGPEIEISRYEGQPEFQLQTGVKLLQEKLGSCVLGYHVNQKCFVGQVTYNGELLGVSHPSVEFEWSQKGGFKIRNWPVILELQKLIDFAKEFEKLSQLIDSPCEKLIGLAFDKVVTSRCRLNVQQTSVKGSSNLNAWFALKLQGHLDIMIDTDEPSLTIDFPEMVVTITKPSREFRLSDLPGFLIQEIAKNSLQIAKQIFSQPKQLTKFMAAFGGIKLSRKVLSGLICRGAHSPNLTDLAEKTLETMVEEVSNVEKALETASRGLASVAEGGATLAELVVSAASVIAQVSVVVAGLGALMSFIRGIIRFFTGKSKELKKAEKRKEEAERKEAEARKIVHDRLTVSGLTISLPELDEVAVYWKPLEPNVKYNVRLSRFDIGEMETILLDKTTEDNKVNCKGTTVKYNSKIFKVSVQAVYLHDNIMFEGKEQLVSEEVKPFLPQPSQLEAQSRRDGREVHVRFSQVKYAVDYKAEVITCDGTIVGSAIVDGHSGKEEITHAFYAEKLTSGAPGETHVRVCAQAQDAVPGEFRYSPKLYLVAAPNDLHVTYESKPQQLKIEWKVSNTQNIARFLCEINSVETNNVIYSREVARPTGDNLKSIVKVRVSEIADHARSPYDIRLCSLGEKSSLASVFVSYKEKLSFLPDVQGVFPSYDPQRNKLTVTWRPVTGATMYEISIREKESNSSVAKKLICEEKKDEVVFEMDEIKMKTGLMYVVSVIAQGMDILHLPSVPSTSSTEFSQLPKPASVSQEYSFKDRLLKVAFKSVPGAGSHVIEVFSKTTPSKIAGRHVVQKPHSTWYPTLTYSFEVDKMCFSDGGPFATRVVAIGNAKLMNSPPSLSPTQLKSGDAPESVSLKYNIQSRQLESVISSKPGHFTLSLEDTAHRSNKLNKQDFVVKQDVGDRLLHQTLFKFPIYPADEPQGAVYQVLVVNIGDQNNLPSEVKKSNEVCLLNPPASVAQEYKNRVFTVAWKSVQSAAGYSIKVFNSKTECIASEERVTHDLCQVGNQMKKEFDVLSMLLESNGLYKSLVLVLGDEVNIGGASTKSESTIPSCSSPIDVNITFNNDTRRMIVSCICSNDGTVRLGVIDATKVKTKEGDIQEALLGWKELKCHGGEKEVIEFDESVLTTSIDGRHKGVAQMIETQAQLCLPSAFSFSQEEVAWLRPALPIHMTFDPGSSTLKITWTPVNLALRYFIEVIQTREEKSGTTTLIPFSDEVPKDAISCSINTENFPVKGIDKFVAKVQPKGNQGLVISLHSIGYSSETLVCEESPTNVDVSQVDNKCVKVCWEGYSSKNFEVSVWKMSDSGRQKKGARKTTSHQLTSTAEALGMSSPGWYRFGVRSEGSTHKLHSVYTEADFLAIIMDAPIAIAMRKSSAVTLQWVPVDNIRTQDYSKYVISYREHDEDSDWRQADAELSATEKILEDLTPDRDYLFCISVASATRGIGIRSPATSVHTDAAVGLQGNLLENPNFAPATGWNERGFAYDIITCPWYLIQPSLNQYRLESAPCDTDDWPEENRNNCWCIAAASGPSSWRTQTINLLDQGFIPEYLDEMKPAIKVYEWFAIKEGCSGAYFIKVSLLDDKKRELPGETPFFGHRQVARSDGTWERLGHVFDNYPSGLRFIRFEDVLDCLGNHGQGYALKVYGATVKFSSGE